MTEWCARWVLRVPTEVVKSNTRQAFDYFYGQRKFIETEYLSENRLAMYQVLADYCSCLAAVVRPNSMPVRLIDVGCGTGHMLRAIEEKFGDSVERHGVDFSKTAIEVARTVVPTAELTIADAYRLPFADGWFHLVLCLETLEHLEYPTRALEEMARVCMPGGYMVVTVPDGDTDSWDGHVHFWNAHDLAQLVSSFDVQEVNCLPQFGALLACIGKPPS